MVPWLSQYLALLKDTTQCLWWARSRALYHLATGLLNFCNIWYLSEVNKYFYERSTRRMFQKVHVLIDFLPTVKMATLIFISWRGSAISSAEEGK